VICPSVISINSFPSTKTSSQTRSIPSDHLERISVPYPVNRLFFTSKPEQSQPSLYPRKWMKANPEASEILI